MLNIGGMIDLCEREGEMNQKQDWTIDSMKGMQFGARGRLATKPRANNPRPQNLSKH